MSRDRPGADPYRRPPVDPIASYEDRPTSVVFACLLVGGGFFMGLLFTRTVSNPAALRGSVDLANPTLTPELLWALVVGLTVAEVGFPLVAVGFLYYRGNRLADLGLGVPGVRDGVAVVAGTAGLLAVNLAVLSGAGALEGASYPLAPSLDAAVAVGAVAAVMFLVVAPAEELLFRGVIQRYLAGPFTRTGAVLATAVLFAAAHVLNASLSASPRVILLVDFVAGLGLGVAYEYTDNLLSPTAIHGAYNTALFSLSVL
jgi:hypothetical protein